jgi:hypothetical protein
MLGSTACDRICRECSIAGVMQDFAARLQWPLSFDFSFMPGISTGYGISPSSRTNTMGQTSDPGIDLPSMKTNHFVTYL